MPAARSSFLGENLNVDSAVSATSLLSFTDSIASRVIEQLGIYGKDRIGIEAP